MSQANFQFQNNLRKNQRLRYVTELGLDSVRLPSNTEQQFQYKRSLIQNRSVSAYFKPQQSKPVYQKLAQSRLRGEKEYVRDIISQKRQASNQRKQQIMNKVKELQNKVLPMLENQRQESSMYDFAWQNRIDQKIFKLEASVEQMSNQLQILIQKKLIEVQQKWQQRFEEIQNIINQSVYSSRLST